MSYTNRQRQTPHSRSQAPQNDGYSSYGNGGGALDFSERTPSNQSLSSRGAQTQYTEAYTQYPDAYTERGMDYSERTPSSQGGYTQGGYTQGGGMDYSERTPSSQGGYTQGGYTQGGYTTSNNPDRTPYSSVDNSGRSSYSSGNRGDSIIYEGRSNNQSSGPSQSRTTNQYPGSDGMSRLSGSSAGLRPTNESMSQFSAPYSQQQHNSTQPDNSSYCASTGGTTVADGGRGRCPYQVEFQVQNQGKQVSSTKRVIYFRYGFANATALSQGKTGTDCRGEEHDIVITWSITGGKRAITMDGREIQYSAGKRANTARRADILEASWRMSDHVYELKCYAYKPAAGSPEKRNPRWKQYILIIDGRSFFELPPIFDLGLKGLRPGIPMPPSQVHSQTPSSMSSLSLSHVSSQPQPNMKGAIQSRIDEQRKLMKARKQAESNGERQDRSGHEDLSSMGSQSGVFSAAPSELDEARNRKDAAPAPLPTVAATQNNNTQEEKMTQYTGTQVSRSGGISRPPKPPQHQIQAQQNQNQPIAHTKQHQNVRPNHPLQNYQIQDKQNHGQQNAHMKQQQPGNKPANRPPQRHQMQAQQTQNPRSARMEKQQPGNIQADHPPPTQQNSAYGHQVQSSMVFFAPQQPPTYEEITRDILGAYDDSSALDSNAGESSIVPRSGNTFDGNSVVTSNAGESSMVPRSGNTFDDYSVAGESPIVPRASSGYDDLDHVSNKGNPMPQKPSQPAQPAKFNVSSSVDTRGVNKWGYF